MLRKVQQQKCKNKLSLFFFVLILSVLYTVPYFMNIKKKTLLILARKGIGKYMWTCCAHMNTSHKYVYMTRKRVIVLSINLKKEIIWVCSKVWNTKKCLIKYGNKKDRGKN